MSVVKVIGEHLDIMLSCSWHTFERKPRTALYGNIQFIDKTFSNYKPMKFVAYQRFYLVEFPASENQFRGCVEDALQV